MVRSFVRVRKGTVTIFDAPNVCTTSNDTFATGTTTESYFTSKNIPGFMRSRNGIVSSFLPPSATSVGPTAINAEGEVTGNYSNANSRVHGFVFRQVKQ